ncbi:glycosyltransferase [Acinetobacter soli]|uniref:glycosyltransferase n=1 Tax=Acinetobacter soli TaxID=487316 RepID=UPI001F1D60E0|nr:glycosyltransferase [Acinetobacter soli]MCF3128333.1 glycosyltransferase [Acinetobacter soli]
MNNTILDSNKNFDRIVFWEPSLSPHKIDLINSLKSINENIEVIYLAANGISDERKALGWSEKGFEDCIVNPNEAIIYKLLTEDSENTMHIFSGIKGGEMYDIALPILKRKKINFCILSEPRANEGVKGFLRYLDSFFFENWIRKKVCHVFAIGANGPKWYESVCYPENKISYYAYFISEKYYSELPIIENSVLNIGFVGRLIEEKGFFDFINSSLYLNEQNYNYTVIGSGYGGKYLNDNISKYSNINYLGAIEMSFIPKEISKLDILVLPSHTTDDGWGMVISEALMAGCYVITTKKVGASLLMFAPEIGQIVDIKAPKAIADAIDLARKNNFLSLEMKQKRKKWALENLSSNKGASFLYDKINGKKTEKIFFSKFF